MTSVFSENIWRMQCELRNKEGVTGMDAMHHILMVLLSKSFTASQCRELKIPEEFAYETMITLNQDDQYCKMYNKNNIKKCLLYHIRNGSRFGFTKDIPFRIIHADTLNFMYACVDQIPSDILSEKTDMIGDIYEHFVNREKETMKDLGQYFTDRSLIRYLVELTKPTVREDGCVETVWDPAAGTGGFLIEYISYLKRMGHDIDWSKNKNQIYGNDINSNTTALLKQNLYYSLKEPVGLTVDMKDTLRGKTSTMFDVILGNPPFGVKGLKHADMNEKIRSLKINGTKGEILFIQLAMTHLKEKGRCCLVVPEGVLFNSTKMYRETRKYLMTNFNLKKVIKMGEGEFFKNTGVKTSVLFFERIGTTTEVEFVQADKVEGSIQEVPLMTVPIDKISENEYSLNMNLYKEIVLDVNEEFEVKMLGDVVIKIDDKLRVTDVSEHDTINYINIGSAQSNSNTYILKTQSRSDYKDKSLNIAKKGDILIASVRPNLRKVLHVESEELFCSGYIILRSSDNILSKFIYYVLRNKCVSDIMSEIAESTSTLYPTINYEYIKNLKIPIPPLSVQERIVAQLDNIYETEIAQSKVVIEGLQSSIEAIMKNTMGRGDLTEHRIGDICLHRKGRGVTKSNRTGGDIPYYASNGQAGDSFMDTHNIEGQFILLAEDGGIGSIHYIEDGTKIWVGDHVHVLNSNTDEISQKYLYLYLKYNVDYELYTTGSVIPKLNKGNLKKISTVLPPPEVQQEILAKIEPKEQLIESLQSNIANAEKEASEIMEVLFN